VYLTAVRCTGFTIVFDGSATLPRKQVSLSNFVHNSAIPSASSASVAAILFSCVSGLQLSQVVFQGNSGEPLWGNANVIDTSDPTNSFVLRGCFFDTAPSASAYSAGVATFTVTKWIPTITIVAPVTLLCGPRPSNNKTDSVNVSKGNTNTESTAKPATPFYTLDSGFGFRRRGIIHRSWMLLFLIWR
jgi:hypothetical protein